MALTTTKTVKIPLAVLAVRKAAWELVSLSALETQKSARDLVLSAVGAGTKWPDLPNRSSAPYDIPVNQFGTLANSIKIELIPADITAITYTDDPVAKLLEDGTPKMAPRPFLTQASYVGETIMRESAPMLIAMLRKL